MIKAYQYPDEEKRGVRGCTWVIECNIDGVNYSARSRSGAPYALARVLVEAGIPDQPLCVVSKGLKGETNYRSVYKTAEFTIGESANTPIYRTRWAPYTGGGTPTD